MLAGGGSGTLRPAPMPFIDVINNKIPLLASGVLPGASKVELLDMTLKTGRNRARLTGFDFLPAFGSAELRYNITEVVVMADLNGKSKDGCEANLASARPDYYDVISTDVYRPVWLSKKGLHIEVYAKFNSYLSGEDIGLDIALVSGVNLRGVDLPFENVRYGGVDPILQPMDTQSWSVSQESGDKYGSVEIDQQGVSLLKFYSWQSELVQPKTMSFTAQQGDLDDAAYSLWADTNWDDVFDVSVCSAGTVSNGKLSFNLADADMPDGRYEVRGDIVAVPVSDHLQLAFDTSGLNAVNTETGKPLQGTMVNGTAPATGAQIRLYTNVATLFSFKSADHELVVKEIPTASPNWQTVEPGTPDLVLEAFTASSTSLMYITHVAITATQGDLSSFTNYVMHWDTNSDGIFDGSVAGELVNEQVVFDGLLLTSPVGNTYSFEIRADARDDIQYGYLRAQLSGDAGISAKRPDGSALATDKIFEQYADQTRWSIYSGDGGGMG
ncbi:MAG: hypothetical protein A2358_04495 [Candidatus Staskawiczbacteria bacterium RIFOXYB1_FULL_37_44]|uniref:Uncharacterized protein n=1 Tax=Candidatus Staskawiczbacteria bacterium RIFOXYB1_FULL_37_44 TaxID=1802223 RepID=A0A1G2IWC2_9BACT|nr:MAG: hypothetical protein A2358_04495 [Candidatus Staskawiczbacteria bacterium RIFOXYB1_FULL_37_44]OGZ89542.1 MAG: hypothetical protein A2581_03705 [Candidatus Staskawiczbacteria bacterium RIFOXYD1_FULL_37_110]